jgi:isopentenyl diphosphate isomerase/L-lactate dehydrogenase-like FMN-dependent dehydrogenase
VNAGEEGVVSVLELLEQELLLCMQLAGTVDLKVPSFVNRLS